MLKKILLDQERILVHDSLSYMAGPVQVVCELVLTNHRILILPHRQWSQALGYQRRNIIWKDIKEISLEKLERNLKIDSLIYNVSLWGSNAKRLFDWIEFFRAQEFSLNTPWSVLEQHQIVLSDDVLVSVGIGLAVTGHIKIKRDGFTLEYQTLERHTKSIQWKEMSDIEYIPMSQKLKFKVKNEAFTLQGNQAQLLNHMLSIFNSGDVFVDCVWEGKWEGTHTNTGFILLGQKALYLLPCTKTSSITNKPYVRIPCSKIQHLDKTEEDIRLFTAKGQIWNISITSPDLWINYLTRLLLHNSRRYQTTGSPVLTAKVHSRKDAITFGKLTLEDKLITFQPNGLRPKREIPVFEVLKMHQRSSRLTLQHEVLPEVFEFIDEIEVENMSKVIEPHLSPMSVSFVGKNQSIDSVIGKVKRLAIYMDGSLLVTINNAILNERHGTIDIKCAKFQEKVFVPNSIQVEVDVISSKGHYVFYALILDNHLNSPDLDGNYSLSTQPIGSVRLINQRADFRIPIRDKMHFSVENCGVDLTMKKAVLVDLSAGGCQLEYTGDLLEADIEKIKQAQTTMTVYLSMQVIEQRSQGRFQQASRKRKKMEQVEFPAKIRRIFQPEDTNKTVFGVEFMDVAPSTEHRLMRKILHLERNLIRYHRDNTLVDQNNNTKK